MLPKTRSILPALLALALGPACYTGLQEAPSGGEADDGGESGAGESSGGDEPPEAECSALQVGASPLARLTRAEYDFTVSDLLGLEAHAAEALPPDGVSGLFAHNGEMTVSSYAVEVYRDLAESLAAEADLVALLPCDPTAGDERECARTFIEQLGRRAFRRDVEPAQIDRLLAVYDDGRDGADFDAGVRLVLEAMLQSPYFLYRVESGVPAPGEELVALDDFELASRLSYFLWRSMPDDELLDAAATGALASDAGVESQARRMLEDPRAERTLLSFYGDLLALDGLAVAYKDPEQFPEYTAELAADMRTELELFVLSTLRDGDGGFAGLLDSSHTFVNARLAEHYGITPPVEDGFVRVELDPSIHRGLLTKPALMSLAAHDQRTSPTLRGKLVRTRLFCQALPPPPGDVDVSIPAVAELSTREWVQQRLDDPSCGACHVLMDPIGLALEGFDAIGRHHTTEGGETIDVSGTLRNTDVDGPLAGPGSLADKLLASEQVGECASRQWLEFALGRPPVGEDACTATSIGVAFSETDHDVTELMVSIATSPAFRTRRPDAMEDQ